jgi:hypothetical protein
VNAFIVDLKNKPGEFATLTEAIAQKGINITSFSGAVCGDTGTVTLVTNDDTGTKQALSEASVKYREVELVTVSIADRPGTLAEVARQFAKTGINVESAVPTGFAGGNVHVAFVTNNPAQAKDAVRQWIVEPAHSR